jgi:hypothetical protein
VAAETVEQGGPTPAQEFEFGPVDYDRVRPHVITQLGKDYITYGGLVELLHQVSEGYFAIDTQLIQAPTQDNGQVAICTAQVLVYDPEDPDVVRRRATGIGDASPANVNRMMATHLIRMAETRAKARALRDAINVGVTAFEELGGEDGAEIVEPAHGAEKRDERPPARVQENRGELPATKKQLNYLEALISDVVDDDGGGMEKFEDMVGKPMGELTREEASEWISRLSGKAA